MKTADIQYGQVYVTNGRWPAQVIPLEPGWLLNSNRWQTPRKAPEGTPKSRQGIACAVRQRYSGTWAASVLQPQRIWQTAAEYDAAQEAGRVARAEYERRQAEAQEQAQAELDAFNGRLSALDIPAVARQGSGFFVSSETLESLLDLAERPYDSYFAPLLRGRDSERSEGV